MIYIFVHLVNDQAKLLTVNMQFYGISRLDILDCFIVRAINGGFEQPTCCMSSINLYSKASTESTIATSPAQFCGLHGAHRSCNRCLELILKNL
jgi:hypothetical protein